MAQRGEAHTLLQMAGKDLKALHGMLDTETFDEEVFGFHAQQAVEKTLKAWIDGMGWQYPCSHDLTWLLHLLEQHGQDAHAYRDVVSFNPFAVQFRYVAFDATEEPMDRVSAIRQVERLMTHVKGLLQDTDVDQ